ncbi:MAG: hypothetical protein ACD_23C00946G0002 [uncultured bacterium]|nr:MAG: hypothetical protein ACD_23C00946G0002 [uncultured bacterium]
MFAIQRDDIGRYHRMRVQQWELPLNASAKVGRKDEVIIPNDEVIHIRVAFAHGTYAAIETWKIADIYRVQQQINTGKLISDLRQCITLLFG